MVREGDSDNRLSEQKGGSEPMRTWEMEAHLNVKKETDENGDGGEG